MLKGTNIYFGKDEEKYNYIINIFRETMESFNINEVILPAIWEAKTFQEKISGDTKNQMWVFPDRANRECCLIPEATGIIQQIYNEKWSKELPKPIWLFYQTRCYRYEKPQSGRYREFTQFGLEVLGENLTNADISNAKYILISALSKFKFHEKLITNDNVKRGLGYYIENGFEIESPILGAQKQIAGGGRYKEGFGWAIGVDRMMLLL